MFVITANLLADFLSHFITAKSHLLRETLTTIAHVFHLSCIPIRNSDSCGDLETLFCFSVRNAKQGKYRKVFP